jgi:hypothetical protein
MEDDRVVIGLTLTAFVRQRKHVPKKGRFADEEVTVYCIETVFDLGHSGISTTE